MPVIKLRGLPWSVSNEDIVKFLHGINISNDKQTSLPSIYLMSNTDGRPSGECFVELNEEIDLENALKKNNQLMGHRYIEVFRSNTDQLSRHKDQSNKNTQNWHDPVVRLRGLPYGCLKREISDFFTGLNIVEDGILMVIDFSGRFNGEAFVSFETLEDALNALDKHREKISNRYIEVFRSTFEELNYYASNAAANCNKNNCNKRNELRLKNQRHKPYNLKTRQSMNQINYDEDNFDNLDSNYYNYDNRNNSSYVCEHNHRHYLNISNESNTNSNEDDNVEYVEEDEDDESFKYGIKMRGLPFSSTEDDVRKFFEPLMPINIILLTGMNGRPNGECEVYFISHNQACEAMKYDKKFIGNRYIELFLLSGSMCSLSNHTQKRSKTMPNRQRMLNRCSLTSSTSSGNFETNSQPDIIFAEMAHKIADLTYNVFKQNFQPNFTGNNNGCNIMNRNNTNKRV